MQYLVQSTDGQTDSIVRELKQKSCFQLVGHCQTLALAQTSGHGGAHSYSRHVVQSRRIR